jgi:hypothetical protein
VTGSDYPMLQDYEEYKETFAYIERPGSIPVMDTGLRRCDEIVKRLELPKADSDKILHHNAQALFGFRR